MNLEHQKDTLIQYLKMKTEIQDWHGVADAAMDLRELEMNMQVLVKIGLRTAANRQESLGPHTSEQGPKDPYSSDIERRRDERAMQAKQDELDRMSRGKDTRPQGHHPV